MSEHTPETSSRRGFFHDAAARIIKPVSEYLEQRTRTPAQPTYLRPPGAAEEARLLETCYRCGACADACPAGAVFLLDRGHRSATGTPAIDPDRRACLLCDGLRCTAACPSGGLERIVDPHAVRMGVAEVYLSLCTRSRGDPCAQCFEACPLGESAIRCSDGGPPEVLATGCVGCGVCQNRCPTEPKAIVVQPR